jgi:NAD-dependent deacetylase
LVQDLFPATPRQFPLGAEEDARLVRLIRDARRILVLSGLELPGVEAEAPPPGDDDGQESWRAYWDNEARQQNRLRAARPSAVHWAIVELEHANKLERVVTHSTDGLQRWAGTSPARLVELHGTRAELLCVRCGARHDPWHHLQRFRTEGTLPRCGCGALLRPATTEDADPEQCCRAAVAAAAADLVIAVGSTLQSYPAASIPLLAAQKDETPYVVIGARPTSHDDHPLVTMRLRGDEQAIFPAIAAAACRGRHRS